MKIDIDGLGVFMREVVKTVEEKTDHYGNNFDDIASRWSDRLNADITAKDVALMMADMKMTRMNKDKDNEDSFKDLIGYLIIYGFANLDKKDQ